ncbi:MAG: hypothetical protein ACE5DU_07550 [Nitrosopumilus sp.]
MISSDDISQMFDEESKKLQNLINVAYSKNDLSVHEIVETYYQVMNVSSMATMLKQQMDSESNPLLEKIQNTEKIITEKFNYQIHPKVTKMLESSIRETTNNLQSRNSDEKSKEETESDAKLFDELRQKMSTKEFVEQYDKGFDK